jgi:hypothetical protein
MSRAGDYIPITVALLGLLGGLSIAILNRRADIEARRRQAYAAAMQVLVEWIEYPYRIRRRTSDDPMELQRLADIGHDIQQRLRYHKTWVLLEHPPTGKLYTEVLAAISERVGAACKNSWTLPPISKATEMNLAGWGPGSLESELSRLQAAISNRFGWRRSLSWVLWPRRLRKHLGPDNQGEAPGTKNRALEHSMLDQTH